MDLSQDVDFEFTGDVIVSEGSVTLRILAQLAHQNCRKEKLHETFHNVVACIFHSSSNERN